MIRFTFAFAALLAMCATSNAAVRTFATDYTGGGVVSVTDGDFELSSNWFAGIPADSADGADVLSTAQVTLSSPLGSIPLPSGVYDLSRVDFDGASVTYITFSQGGYGVNDLVFAMAGDYPFVSGADLPDGSSTNVTVFGRIDYLGANQQYDFPLATGVTATIGTAAVPEPSAFAFGGLALAVTGAGRWARRRFFA